MSDDRQPLPSDSVDQRSRAEESRPAETVPTEDDIVANLQRQMQELEERDRQLSRERDAERQRAATEARRREEAEARARDADERANREAEQGRRSSEDAQHEAITTALTAHQNQITGLEEAYKAAAEDGDWAKAAGVQRQMALLGGQIAQLETTKRMIEQRKEGREAAPAPRESFDTQREAFINSQPPLVRDWLREHPRYFTDAGWREEVIAAANYATRRKGLSVDSQEYIDFVNADLGLSEPRSARQDNGARNQRDDAAGRADGGMGREAGGAGESRSRPPAGNGEAASSRQDTSRRLVAAPAGGGVPSASGGPANQTYLTRDQKEFIRQHLRDHQGNPISEADYAQHQVNLQNEGLIGNVRNR